jgi:hypothetical protein
VRQLGDLLPWFTSSNIVQSFKNFLAYNVKMLTLREVCNFFCKKRSSYNLSPKNLTLSPQHYFGCVFRAVAILRHSIVNRNDHWSFPKIFTTHLDGARVADISEVNMTDMLECEVNAMAWIIRWVRSSREQSNSHTIGANMSFSCRKERRLKRPVSKGSGLSSFMRGLISKVKRDFCCCPAATLFFCSN